MELFNHYYRKHSGATGNPYSIGLNSADMMINNFQSTIQTTGYDTRNEN